MAKAEISFLAGDEGAIRAAQRLREELDKAAEAGVTLATKSTRATKEAAGEMSELGKLATGFAGGVTAAVAAFGPLKSILDEITGRMQRMKELTASIAAGAVGTQARLLPLAGQLGLTPEETARVTLAGVRATGASPDVFNEVARTVDSLFTDPRKTAEQNAKFKQYAANAIAATVGRVGGGPQTGNALAELLTRVPGASDSPAALARAIAEMDAGAKQTGFTDVGEMAGATGKGALNLLLKGASLREALGRQGQARSVSSSRDESAELLKQMVVFTESDYARRIIQDRTGADATTMSIEKKFDVLAKAVASSDPAAMDALFEGVPGEQRSRVERFFSPRAEEAYRGVLGAVDAADPADVSRKNAAFRRTAVGQAAAIRAGEEYNEATVDRYHMVAGELHRAAKSRLDHNRAIRGVGLFSDLLQSEHDQIGTTVDELQLRNLGIEPEEVGGSWYSNFKLGTRKRLDAERRKRGLPTGAIFGPGGEAFVPPGTTVNHYGDVYQLGQQDVTRPPEPIVEYN